MEACCLVDSKNLEFRRTTDGGAGFYRFPAWARMKSNDVSPGHAIQMRLLASSH